MGNMTRLGVLFGAAALLLAACDDDDNGGGGNANNPQDEFGATFAQAFDADQGDDPIDPQPGDAGELSLTDDPVDF